MGKSLFIAEKPSVAQEFAKALKYNTVRRDGYVESDEAVVTWCVGHLVTMSYPEEYDPALKRWSLDTLPFIPKDWKYEVIEGVKKQFNVVSGLLNRPDIDTIYVCTDSGREGEYIYRLVEQEAHVEGKNRRRVWIDSQTEEEILRGIREAKDLSEYDALADAAYLRAKEDYLMGINFSRVLTLKYGNTISNYLKQSRNTVIAVGRVMTCVQGMIVKREREIRQFVETPFYRVLAKCSLAGSSFEAEWRAVEGWSVYYASPKLYKENGFNKEEDAKALIELMSGQKLPYGTRQLVMPEPVSGVITGIEKKKENKSAPLLFNLAELQNECSRLFKISPDETLRITQELYEKKLVTYPRTDARVLSTAVAKEIHKNIGGLRNFQPAAGFAAEILESGSYKGIAKTKYTNDKQITDHYAIIPTGQTGAVKGLSAMAAKVYEAIVKRFLAIFYPPAVYRKVALVIKKDTESLFSSFKVLVSEGYLKVAGTGAASGKASKNDDETEDVKCDAGMLEMLQKLKKGDIIPISEFFVKEGKTSPPKRYNSGSIILAMENAGQLIEDEELRAQIKGSGIGTSATRAEILKKLIDKGYIKLNNKTQIITPTLLGEMIYDVVAASIKYLLDPTLTASWEKGLTGVADATISCDEYLEKLEGFVTRRTLAVKQVNNQYMLRPYFDYAAAYYKQDS